MFSELLDLTQILHNLFGYEKFKEGQREIIDSIISGNPTLAILPTGGGKSLCYQLPALIAEKPSIVISPMISLMKDQVDKLNSSEKRAGFINSTQSFREAETVLREVFDGKIKLLYLSPEKITSANFLQKLKEIEWEYLFVDEAHCISEWGHNFRPSYRKIYEFAEELNFGVISAFTATATPEVRRDIVMQLRMDNPKIFVSGFERPNLSLNVLSPKDKKSKLAAIARSSELPAIVYCSTRKETEEVADFLRLHGFAVNHYHAGLSSELRKMIQEDFLRDKLEIIVATNAFGMGIDKDNIRTVIHYNITASLEHYYQEIGRAGRDGKISKIYLFYSKRDFAIHEYLITNSFPSEEEIKIVYDGVSDYMRVALGNSYDKAISMDKSFFAFFEKKNISKAKLENALRALENSGYVEISRPQLNDYKIEYFLPPRDLKNYIKNIAKKEYAEILTALAKLYLSSPFTEPTKISIYKIASVLGLHENHVTEKLRELDLRGIIKFVEPRKHEQIRLKTTRVRSSDLNISNEINERLIENSLAKLNVMKKYADTEKCRMAFILNYFGDSKDYKCGICDNCGETVKSNSDSELAYLEEIIFNTINTLKRDVYPAELFNALIGKKEKTSLLDIPDFGALQAYSVIELDEALENLIAQGKVSVRGNKIVVPENKPSVQRQKIDYEKELQLFNKLAELRKETARKFNQPIYMICSDEVLRNIVKAKPKSEFELLAVKGFTRTVYNKFGEDILRLLKQFFTDKN